MNELNIIEIEWDGPYVMDEIIEKMDGDTDYGVYQIYGTHNINGPNTLLYIGKVEEQTFSQRFKQHEDWLSWEPSELQVYVGRIGGIKQPDDEDWVQAIADAERLLIYYCAPPYNSSNINKYGDIESTIILNHGKKNALPLEVSTLYEESDYVQSDDWEPYADE